MTAYATSEELATFLGSVPAPEDQERLLTRASELIDDYLRTALYAVDDDGLPTDPAVTAALRDAACAQVEFWLAGDEEDDILGPVQSVSLSGLSMEMGAAQYRTAPMALAPRAARILRSAGICNTDVVTL